jgi:hypothetical protein
MIESPTRYLQRNADKPLAWLKVFGFFGLFGGVLAGFRQGGLEAALLCSFVGGVVGSVVGLLAGVAVWLFLRLLAIWNRRGPG